MLIQSGEFCERPAAMRTYIAPSVSSMYVLSALIASVSLDVNVDLDNTRITASRLRMDQRPGE